MDSFTCITCSTSGGEAEVSKHLTSSRHKTVKYNKLDEIVECEECEDSNVHQLLVVRFGLSDMALLCQSCLSKDEKPSTQYSLSNGSLMRKLIQYFQFRDIECKDCEDDEDLFVGNNKKTGSQIIVCKSCLPKNEDPSFTFVSENDDNFLNELLGIREFIPPKNLGRKGRHRKLGRKGGKKFGSKDGRNPRKAKPGAEERKAHYERTKSASMAIKSGKTLLAVGSENSTPASSTSSSKVITPRSSTPVNKGKKVSNNQISMTLNKKLANLQNSGSKNNRKFKEKSSEKATKVPESSKNKNSVKSKKKTDTTNSNGDESKGRPKKSPVSVEKEEKSSVENKNSEKDDKKPKKNTSVKEKENAKNTNQNGNSNSRKNKVKSELKSNSEVNKEVIAFTKTKEKNSEVSKKKSKNQDKNSEKSDLKCKEKIVKNHSSKESEKTKSTKQKQTKSKKKDAPSKEQDTITSKENPSETISLPPGISKYEPSAEPKLSYEDMNSYFEEMSYNLYLEEKLGNQASNNDLSIDSTKMTIEWYADQDKKNKQYKINIPLTDEILESFISKKMQNLKKTPFSLNQAVFLVLNDEIPWYGQIVTVDSKSASKGRRGGLKIFEMVVELYKWNKQPLPLSVNAKWLKLLPASIPVSRVFLAMSRIENPKFISMILGNEPIKQIVFKNYLRFTKDTFNESQKVAIQSVLNNSITVLQGPPGTGKTSTIYEIILQLLDNLHTFPILVVAASNIAIDNIAEKLLEKHGRSILRIVANEKEKEYNREHPLASICLHHKVYDALPLAMKQTIDDMKRFNGPKVSQNQYKKLLSKQIELSDIFTAQAKVIFTTTVVAGGNQLKSVKKLPVVIMDEATQSSEPTTLIPLSMPGVEKFVFVGDQKQLSSFSQVPNLSLSLFERVLLNKTYKTPHMLDTQYRMHPAISDFPRRRFYDGLLKDGISKGDRKLDNIPSNPVYVWDTCGKIMENRVKIRFREDRGYTYVNEGEVNLIQKVLLNLIYEKGISRSEIGIITPYRGQRDLISSILVKDELVNPEKEDIHIEVDRDDIYNDSKPVTIHTVSDIMIASIDAFQGRERNFLIISCVRSNKENKIGFLNDERRLNVALTRAKYGLIVVGDVNCLSSGDPLWKEYLTDLTEKGSVHIDSEFTY